MRSPSRTVLAEQVGVRRKGDPFPGIETHEAHGGGERFAARVIQIAVERCQPVLPPLLALAQEGGVE
jgi:hypothetical protein